MADKTLKVRTSGIRVFHEESSKYGIIWNLKGSDLVKVLWDEKDGEQSGGEYRVGADENGVEHYDLRLHAVHSYIKLSGAGDAGEDEDAQALNGIYVMSNDGFIPEYYQMKGPGRISFNPDEGMWTIWSSDFGKIQYFYEIFAEVLDVPVEGWECTAQWDPEISPPPTITKHELQVGQDVKLRKHHPDNHIPAEKYPGPPCAFNNGDICTIERIQGLFFAPKISPDQWIPLRAAVPAAEMEKLEGEDDETPTRLAKAKGSGSKLKDGKNGKDGKDGKAKSAAGGGANAIKLIKTLVEKVDNLETEVKKLQK